MYLFVVRHAICEINLLIKKRYFAADKYIVSLLLVNETYCAWKLIELFQIPTHTFSCRNSWTFDYNWNHSIIHVGFTSSFRKLSSHLRAVEGSGHASNCASACLASGLPHDESEARISSKDLWRQGPKEGCGISRDAHNGLKIRMPTYYLIVYSWVPGKVSAAKSIKYRIMIKRYQQLISDCV